MSIVRQLRVQSGAGAQTMQAHVVPGTIMYLLKLQEPPLLF